MSVEIEIADANQDDAVAIAPPKIKCSELEANQIMEELGMGVASSAESAGQLSISKLMKLGVFASGEAVALEGGAVLISRGALVKQILRLNALAERCGTVEDMADISKSMAILGATIAKLTKIGTRSDVVIAAPADNKPRVESWPLGTAVQAQAGATVIVNGGVASQSPPV